MEQTNSLALNMLQSIASQAAGIPKTGKTESGDELSDFQKLLDEKAQEKDPLVEQPAKSETKVQTEDKKAGNAEKVPVQKKEEDPVEISKKAQIVVVGPLDPETLPDPVALEDPVTEGGLTSIQGDWSPQAWAYESTPEEIAGDPSAVGEGMQLIDVSDPEADAILEATAPGADDSPAAMLEELVDDQIGQVAQEAVEEVQPQDNGQEDDSQVEILDVEQAPQRIFHDVQSVPVKVGETEAPQQGDEPNVAQQIDSQLVQAMQKGESMVRVQLNPENLGSVTVEISQSAQGVLRIALSAHSIETRSLLERHAGELQGMLSDRTQQTVEVDVQRQQESQQSQQQNYEGHNGHAQDGQERRRQQQEHTSSQDFMQQLRLGLIPAEEA